MSFSCLSLTFCLCFSTSCANLLQVWFLRQFLQIKPHARHLVSSQESVQNLHVVDASDNLVSSFQILCVLKYQFLPLRTLEPQQNPFFFAVKGYNSEMIFHCHTQLCEKWNVMFPEFDRILEILELTLVYCCSFYLW